MDQGFRLSPQQRRLWSQHGGDAGPYRAQALVLIEGHLDAKRLQKAIEGVVARHEILRTSFVPLPGLRVPVQVIAEAGLPRYQQHDLSAIPPGEREARIEALWHEGMSIPFDLDRGPLLHVGLVTHSPTDHNLLITAPALCVDASGLNVLVRDVARLYAGGGVGHDAPSDVAQYADLAEWHNQLLEAEEGERGRAFWRARWQAVAGDGLHLILPFAESTPGRTDAGFHPAVVEVPLPPDRAKEIETRSPGAPLPVFLLACWQALLWRLTGAPGVTVGLGASGRRYEELAGAMGLLARYLPLGGRVDASTRFDDLLVRTRESAEEIEGWGELFSWEGLGEAGPAFFSFCFDAWEAPARCSAGDVSFSVTRRYVCIDRFDVKLSWETAGERSTIALHYNAHLYRSGDMERLAAHLRTLVESALARPEATVGRLEILPAGERRRILVEFNRTRTDSPGKTCIHALIEAQARRIPNSTAVAGGEQTVTYAELDGRAERLAHRLRALGVGPGILVGLSVERSAEMVVGILGILKAGGAYVPLDPAYPREWIAFMLEDTRAPVIVTRQGLIEDETLHGARVLHVNGDGATLPEESQRGSRPQVTADDPAYVIYTSGSTGRPKGVMVTHRNLAHSISARTGYYREPVSKFLLLSSFAFDSSVAGIFWTLCQGGSLILPEPGLEHDPSRLLVLIAEHRVSHTLVLPSLYGLILAEARPNALASLRTVIVAGEACSARVVERHQERLPHAALFNEYGPTEGTVWSTVYQIEPARQRAQILIGRPIANTWIYLLDENLQPVPIGVPAELYVGGEGVAVGYLNRPDETAARFIPDPFGERAGARLYRTGDLARYLPDGNIEFLGRVDHQVKIRGYRIELEEIETALEQHPAVREAAVTALGADPGDKRLAAYIVGDRGSTPAIGELRSFLAQRLPEYMVPSAFVVLKTLPRTPNGKIDRQALPTPGPERPELEEAFVAPRTPNEKVLAEIWGRALGLERVGVHDNFFELGGDSILSIRIVAQAIQAGLQLTPMQIFQRQTVAELAQAAGTVGGIRADQGRVTGVVPLTPIQHWFLDRDPEDPHHFTFPMLLEVRTTLDLTRLEHAAQALVTHHDALRLRFVRTESGWEQRHAEEAGLVTVTRFDLSGLPDTGLSAAIEAHAAELATSLDLSEGPLLRVAVLDPGGHRRPRLLIVVHHLVVDVVSWRVLLEDLQTVYEQLSRGEPVRLPPKTTSFKRWAERLQGLARSGALDGELDYWLETAPAEVPALPVDFPEGREPNTVAVARTVSVALGADETRTLLQEVPRTFRTQINDVLLAALAVAFAPWTGQPSLLLDLEAHGREDLFEDVDLSRTVGWFTTLTPVLLSPGKSDDPVDALKAVKEQLRRIPNRGIGYGLLRDLSGRSEVADRLRRLPQPRVDFNYLGQIDQLLPDASLFAPARESTGSDRSPRARRGHLLEMVAFVRAGRLEIEWTYNSRAYRQATIAGLGQGYLAALRAIIARAQLAGAGAYTPSDFPEADLSEKELEDLLVELDDSDG